MVNPYQAPKAVVADQAPGAGELAGLGQRLGAALIDLLIALVYAVPMFFIMGLGTYISQNTEPPIGLTLLSTVLGFVFFVLIHGYFLKKNGQTIGKKLLGIRITDLDDQVPPFGKLIALRYLPITLVTLIPFIGNLLVLVDVLFIFRSDRRCVHDLIAGTQVVRA